MLNGSHVGLVAFEVLFTLSLLCTLERHMPLPVRVEAPLTIAIWLVVIGDGAWFARRCYTEFTTQPDNALNWFWVTSRNQNYIPLVFIVVDIFLVPSSRGVFSPPPLSIDDIRI